MPRQKPARFGGVSTKTISARSLSPFQMESRLGRAEHFGRVGVGAGPFGTRLRPEIAVG